MFHLLFSSFFVNCTTLYFRIRLTEVHEQVFAIGFGVLVHNINIITILKQYVYKECIANVWELDVDNKKTAIRIWNVPYKIGIHKSYAECGSFLAEICKIVPEMGKGLSPKYKKTLYRDIFSWMCL